MSSILLPAGDRSRTWLYDTSAASTTLCCRSRFRRYRVAAAIATAFLLVCALLGARLGTEFLRSWKRAISGSAPCCRRPSRSRLAWTASRACATSSELSARRTVVSEQGRGRMRPIQTDPSCGVLRSLEAAREWPKGLTKRKLVRQLKRAAQSEFVGVDFNFSQYIKTTSRKPSQV